MTEISSELVELENLLNLANYHHNHCNNSECGVTLFIVKRTAERLVQLILALRGRGEELDKAKKLVKQFPR